MHSPAIALRPGFRTAILVGVLTISLAACSSGSETTSSSDDGDAAETPTTQSEPAQNGEGPTEESASGGNSDCETMEQHAAVLRSANGWLPQIVDEEQMRLFSVDLDLVDEAIDGLRPIQDIDGLFGTSREGLDNMATDIQALRDGQFDEKVGEYDVAGLTAVIGEEICS